jgi:hypothetical protein
MAAPRGSAPGPTGYLRLRYDGGEWRLPNGEAVPWPEVTTDLYDADRIRGAVARVLSVYGISDVVMEAFGEFDHELFGTHDEPAHGA